MREVGQGQRLQPDSARAGKRGEEDSVAAEEHVADAADPRDLETDAGREHADMAGMDPQGFVRRKVVGHDFAPELDEGLALTTEFLQEKTIAAENARA